MKFTTSARLPEYDQSEPEGNFQVPKSNGIDWENIPVGIIIKFSILIILLILFLGAS